MKSNWKVIESSVENVGNADLHSLPMIVQKVLLNRGIENPDNFFSSSSEDLHDPFLIFNMDRAVKRILQAVEKKEKIVVYGDYDVDGVCATAILWEFLYRELKADVLPYIPHRVDEGYGLNEDSLQELINNGVHLVITVDCGIRDKELVQKFEKDVDLIITDHHTVPEDIPNTIVIHPRHPKGKYPFGEISGGTVSWKLVTALKKKLGLNSEEDLMRGIDLAAFSTVCDVMPLVGENRTIVKLGLDEIKKGKRLGLTHLMNDADVKKEDIDAYHFGFVLGPRINASGRLDHALDAVRLLVTESASQALDLARKLSGLNVRRQEITKDILEIAEQQVLAMQSEKLLFAYGEGWPEGIVGLVAGRLTEKYHKPCLVASLNGEEAVGSARSISAFNVIEAIDKSGDKLLRYGGHAQAAGFTVTKENIEDFRDSLQVLANEVLKDEDLVGEIEIDAEVEFPDLTFDLYEWLEKLKPFGYKNPTPDFLTRGAKIASVRAIGKDNKHLKLILFKEDIEFDAIAFGMGVLVEKLEVGQLVDVVYGLDVNVWNGKKSLQLKVKDVDCE